MGDEKDYFDKMFSLVDKSLVNNEKIKEAQTKLETNFTVFKWLFAAVALIIGRNDPVVQKLIGMFIK